MQKLDLLAVIITALFLFVGLTQRAMDGGAPAGDDAHASEVDSVSTTTASHTGVESSQTAAFTDRTSARGAE